jgi:hypothetical protein
MSARGLRCSLALAALAVALAASPARASDIPLVDKCSPLSAIGLDATPVGPVFKSDNVDFLGTVGAEAGDLDPGGRLIGHYFYVTGQTHFSIYDVADPLHPKFLSRVDFPCRFENEDVAVNGDILIWTDFATTGDMFVYDVRDKSHPKLAADVPGAGTHTIECLDGCRFGYGSYHLASSAGALKSGEVVDLLDPSHPKVLGDWTDGGVLDSRSVHDVTEIAPDRMLTASAPIELLDTSRSVVHPTVLARSDTDPTKRYHTVIWPREGQDRFVLASFETNATPNCGAGSGDFSTFDASQWQTTHTLKLLDSYHLSNGTQSDTNPPANVLGCSPHWFNVRPSWRDGGVVALAAYDHGTKFLRVDGAGKIKEIGAFLPPGTQSSGAYWITCDVVYVVDYTRGIDIVRLNDATSTCPARSGDATAGSTDAAAGGGAPVSEQPSLQHALSRGRCASRRHFRIRLRLPRGIHRRDVRRATVRVGHRRERVLRGARVTAPVDLRGLPPNRFAVRVRLTLKDGRTVTDTRRYRTCASRR